MAGTTSNKFIPILGIITIAIVIVVVYRQFTSDRPSDSNPLTRIPTPDAPQQLPGEAGADNDTQAETLRTVAVSNEKLRADVAQVLELNKKLQEENRRLGGSKAQEAREESSSSSRSSSIDPVGQEPLAKTSPDTKPGMVDRANAAMGSFAEVLQMNASPTRAVTDTERANANRARPQARATGSGVMAASAGTQGAEPGTEDGPDGERMRTLVPMGYSAVIDAPAKAGAQGNAPAMTRYVRTSGNESFSAVARMSAAGAAGAAQTAAAAPKAAAKAQPVPYFTVPENSTLVGVTSMTSIIGRVPIDGRVTDPMQFKAIVGRDNLAANGFELPPDLEGMIVTGIAIGDMALSCSEGKVRSITFVFNDGTVRTVSTRSRAGGGGSSASASASGQDLGFISDEYGNPCVPGQFVTNAPAYLADIALIKGLDVAASAYADAQRTVSSNLQTGSTTSQVTGNTGGYAMAQAASGAADELVQWMTSRMKNSFDAVVTPAGRSLVIHVDKELQIDKMPDARKLVYRQQGGRQTVRGEHYGLE